MSLLKNIYLVNPDTDCGSVHLCTPLCRSDSVKTQHGEFQGFGQGEHPGPSTRRRFAGLPGPMPSRRLNLDWAPPSHRRRPPGPGVHQPRPSGSPAPATSPRSVSRPPWTVPVSLGLCKFRPRSPCRGQRPPFNCPLSPPPRRPPLCCAQAPWTLKLHLSPDLRFVPGGCFASPTRRHPSQAWTTRQPWVEVRRPRAPVVSVGAAVAVHAGGVPRGSRTASSTRRRAQRLALHPSSFTQRACRFSLTRMDSGLSRVDVVGGARRRPAGRCRRS